MPKIRVRVLTAGLENPWSLEFLRCCPDHRTERRLRPFKDGNSPPGAGPTDVVSDNFISVLTTSSCTLTSRRSTPLLGLQQADAPAVPRQCRQLRPQPSEEAESPAAAAPGRGAVRRGAGVGQPAVVAWHEDPTVPAVSSTGRRTKVEDIIRCQARPRFAHAVPAGRHTAVSTYGEPQQMAQDKMWPERQDSAIHADGTIPKDHPFVGKKATGPNLHARPSLGPRVSLAGRREDDLGV